MIASHAALTPVAATSVGQLIMDAGPVGKLVLAVLVIASIVSWGIIYERWRSFSTAARETRSFLTRFHGGARLADLADLAKGMMRSPVAALFRAAFHEVSQHAVENPTVGRVLNEDALGDVERMIARTAAARTRELERSLTFLATVASTSPFIGLFGTVWGIMDAFARIGTAGVASIESYAPGIAEALVATAAGLIAAVPAAIAYNTFLRQVRVMTIEMDEFQLDFVHLLEKRRRRAG